ncbi:MAG TPA: tRNA (N(6)-L-threonylcarbamoyladenosine(37)-C(2))-methylthiotransferase MtaB [Aggregatilineales bacterium]|nr:tRNA (N(6)-L-threonylcarbamoyladenosine(37)-C(2))-methylthiotransferase MtaB [Aggregatilineales bacterium]
MKVHLTNLGCRLNQAEIDNLARDFLQRGDEIVEASAKADLMVVNTCAVTREAERSSRQVIYRLHRANLGAQIAITGCYASLNTAEGAALPGVTHVVGNDVKDNLVSIVTGQALDKVEVYDAEPFEREKHPGIQGRTRAFVKVQDGCDRHCSFCVTRLARGKGRSRDLIEIVQEVQKLHSAGYQECVLTGVHLGSYGQDLGHSTGLYELVKALLNETDVPRIRLSSLEPWGLAPGFFRLWDSPRLCPHLHLPLQSGCDATLRRMIRRTSQREFRAVVESAREAIPDVAIATDVIVGFPGETDAEFAISRDFIEAMDFADMHVFRFSVRPGTAAARLLNPVNDSVKQWRSDKLQELSHAAHDRYARRFVGMSLPVLWEGVSGATEHGFVNAGFTPNHLRVQCVYGDVLTNNILLAHLLQYDTEQAIMQGALC